jgi:thiol-disulfide isomerase/thioredoxin
MASYFPSALGAALIGAALLLGGCKVDEPAPLPAPDRPARARPAVDVVAAPAGDVAATVQRELTRAKAEGKRLVVYVGATWCEPCQYFHDAAQRGELDSVFPDLRLLEFDLDRDQEALTRAGYASKMIPLFALPKDDGTGSGQQIEGSIKGAGAVGQITPRLKALLAKGP